MDRRASLGGYHELVDRQISANAQRPRREETTEELLRRLRAQHGKDALVQATAARIDDPRNIPLRNAEHALFSHELAKYTGPLGPAVLAPAYSGAKAVVQSLPQSMGQAVDKVLPTPLYNATPPSLEEVKWGLAPLWQRSQ